MRQRDLTMENMLWSVKTIVLSYDFLIFMSIVIISYNLKVFYVHLCIHHIFFILIMNNLNRCT